MSNILQFTIQITFIIEYQFRTKSEATERACQRSVGLNDLHIILVILVCAALPGHAPGAHRQSARRQCTVVVAIIERGDGVHVVVLLRMLGVLPRQRGGPRVQQCAQSMMASIVVRVRSQWPNIDQSPKVNGEIE